MPIEIESPEELGYGTIRYNLAESSVRDIAFKDLQIDLSEQILFYGEHRGLQELRQVISSESDVLKPDDILVCSGAATALFIIATTLLSAKDHLVVIRPNYGTNLETPRAIGCQMSIIDLLFEENFDIDIQQVEAKIQPNTKVISITNPHNPTGKFFSENTINQLVKLAEKHNCYLLVDETYRDLNFQTSLKLYVAEQSNRVISVCSLSKAFGVPGIRIGWIACQDATLMNIFLAAKEQMIIGNSVIDEAIALHLLKQKQTRLAPVHEHIRSNFAYTTEWMQNQPYLEWLKPMAGVVCFPKLRSDYQLNTEKFYQDLYQKYQTMVGAGHWFEQPDTYFRIGFGYPTLEELKMGLENFKRCLRENIF